MKFMKISFLALAALLLSFSTITSAPTSAQDADRAITITGPPWMSFLFNDENLFNAFQEKFPGLRVVYIEPREDYFSGSSITDDPADYLDRMERYVSMADVVYIDQYYMTAELVTAGYLLNLMPLVQTDPDLNPNDFYQGAWQTFQWEGGMWALPVSVSPRFFIYSPQAFDAVGIRYPGPQWTLEDFASALRSLTEFDSAGNVVLPAYAGWIDSSIIQRFLGEGFYDFSTQPNPPALNSPALNAIINTLAALNEEGLLNIIEFQGNYNQIPLRVEGPWALNENFFAIYNSDGTIEQTLDFEPALMPGGASTTYASGFAVSAGTEQPEIAYELAKFILMNGGQQFGGESPLRSQRDQFADMYGFTYSPEDTAFIDQVLENALSAGELRYGNYLDMAIQQVFNEDIPVETALEEAQAKAMAAYEMALERAQTHVIQVAPAPPPVQLAPGEIRMTLGIQQPTFTLQNRDAWDQLVLDFIASEPGVGHLDLNSNFYGPEGRLEADCYIQDFNNIPNMDLESLINLDPFLDADPNFNPNDVLGGVMTQMQRDGRTWALPLYIRPIMLQYDRQRLQAAGAPLPDNGGWTSDTFTQVLRDMRQVTGEDTPVFMLGGSNFEWYMLMAAYGGSPFDYNSSPPGVNFTAPSVVSAITQVLDMARQGLIGYYPLSPEYSQSSTRMMMSRSGLSSEGPAIFLTRLYTQMFDQRSGFGEQFSYAPFLRGSQVTPIAYDVGAAYISADAQDPAACYRLISQLATRLELADGMPVRQSQLNDPMLEITKGAQLTALYRDLAATIQSPNTQYFGYTYTTPSLFFETMWLNTVFDEFVLSERGISDIEGRLLEAQEKTLAFRACAAELPPFEIYTQYDEAYYEEYFNMIDNCGLSVDENWVSPFGSR